MARRVYIVKASQKITAAVKANAAAAKCPEIARGIPPRLAEEITEAMLPYAYEEPEASPAPIVRDLVAEVDAMKARLDKLERDSISIK